MGGDYRLRPGCVQAADLVPRLAEYAFRRLSALYRKFSFCVSDKFRSTISGGDYRLLPRYVQAADLVTRLAEFAFRRLSASDQLKQIDELVSKNRGRGKKLKRSAELNVESDEDFRVKTFMELFSKQAFEGYSVFFDILQKFSDEEVIFLFKQLGSNDQQELVQKMLDRINEETSDTDDEDILNRPPEESEEDFILRRFTKLYNTYPYFLWFDFGKKEAAKYLLNSGKEITQFHHSEFWVGVSRIWFETLSADEQGEHIAVLTRKLLGDEAKDCTRKLLGDEAKAKLPGESEADFRVSRFKELFEKLEPDSQRYLLGHIKTTLRDDLGLPHSCAYFSDARSLFNNEIIKFINPNPREAGGVGKGGATLSAQGGGGGRGQGTSSTTTSAQAS